MRPAAVGLWLRCLLAALLCCAALSGTAGAQDASPVQNQREVLIQIDLADLMRDARGALRDGDLERAVGLYRLIVSLAPNFRTARIELSLALAAVGERERAARLLRDIDTDGLDPEVIDVINRIVGPDRLNFFFTPELFLDSNVTGQTKDRVIRLAGLPVPLTLSDEALGQRSSGYGLTFGASYRILDDMPRTTLTAGATLRDFEGEDQDEQSLFGSLSARFPIGDRLALTPSLSTVYRYDNWRPREFEIGAGLAASMALGPVRNTLGGRYRFIKGQEDDGGSRLDRDSYEIYDTISFGFGGVALRLEERATFEDWDNLPAQSSVELESGLDITFVEAPWVIPTIGGSYTHRDFRSPLGMPFNTERLDRVWEGHIEIVFRDLEIFGSNPFVRYQYSDQSSNIELFEFDEHEFSVGIRTVVF